MPPTRKSKTRKRLHAAKGVGRRKTLESLFRLIRELKVPEDFMQNRDDAPPQKRRLF